MEESLKHVGIGLGFDIKCAAVRCLSCLGITEVETGQNRRKVRVSEHTRIGAFEYQDLHRANVS